MDYYTRTQKKLVGGMESCIKKMKKPNYISKKSAILINDTNESVIKIILPYSISNLKEMHSIDGRKWNKKDKFWTIPLSLENVFKLKKWKYSLEHSLRNWANKEWKRERDTIKKLKIKKLKIKNLKGTLFPFQKKGVIFLENHNGRALLADEMGLGKTIQALAWLQLHRKKRPVIIICPASLKLNWEAETRKWIEYKNIQILSGNTPHPIFNTDILIINFDILSYWILSLKKIAPQIIIIDEAHYMKSNSTKRTKAIKQLCKDIPHIIALSGTPIMSKPVEIYNIIHLLNPSIFPNKWTFLHKYCGAKHNGFGWDFSGATNAQELHQILTNKIMIRRKKKNVLKDLPDKIYSLVPLNIDNRKEYNEAEQDFIQYILDKIPSASKQLKKEKTENATILAQIEELKQLAAKGKMNFVIKWIEIFLESDEKLILFATHKFVINTLMLHFDNLAVKIDGSVNQKKRQEAVKAFQNLKKIKLFIGNIQAAGEGISLTASSNVAFIEYPWTPGKLIQAADRAHRINQKYTVNIHYLIASDTIEEKIAILLNKKQKVLDTVLDGVSGATNSSILIDLLKEYRN